MFRTPKIVQGSAYIKEFELLFTIKTCRKLSNAVYINYQLDALIIIYS